MSGIKHRGDAASTWRQQPQSGASAYVGEQLTRGRHEVRSESNSGTAGLIVRRTGVTPSRCVLTCAHALRPPASPLSLDPSQLEVRKYGATTGSTRGKLVALHPEPIEAPLAGVRLTDTLRLMRDVLAAHASPSLSAAIAARAGDILAMAERVVSVKDLECRGESPRVSSASSSPGTDGRTGGRLAFGRPRRARPVPGRCDRGDRLGQLQTG